MVNTSSAPQGKWTGTFNFPNVLVHATLLPNGKILHWGRRQDPAKDPSSSDDKISALNEHFTKSFLWTPPAPGQQPINGVLGKSEAIKDENQPLYTNPKTKKVETVNLFCGGHCLLPSGNVLAVGGHWVDGEGVEQASIFDYTANKWIPQTGMNHARWYPSALTLPDGRALCLSGSDNNNFDPNINNIPQIFPLENLTSGPAIWTEVLDPVIATRGKLMLDLYPRLHVDPRNGSILMVGPKPVSWYLDLMDDNGAEIKNTNGVIGRWREAGTQRNEEFRDYAPSVMYSSGKIMYIGGGSNASGPTPATEFIDLNTNTLPAKWSRPVSAELKTARKQFNATVLPDGQVLVSGGTSGGGFNDFGNKVLTAEMMDPNIEPKAWTVMAAENFSRCYHSIALLLPDGRVLSAGGGEYGDCGVTECHKEAQLFEPPYLFNGVRPTIVSAPTDINYKSDFIVTVSNTDTIGTVSLIRLGSVTHCRNMNQQLVFLDIVKKDGPKISIRAPATSNIAPPGHYMLFVLNEKKVPSVAAFVRLPIPAVSAPVGKLTTRLAVSAQHVLNTEGAHVSLTVQHEKLVTRQIQLSLSEHDERITAEQARPPIAVGLTPLCPYGLGPCWGGAYDGLKAISEIDVVRPVPSSSDCLAFVYTKQDTLPDIDIWRKEFETVANKSYNMRGFEMTLSGTITKNSDGSLTLASTTARPEVVLAPFQASSQLKWDIKAKAPRATTDAEAGAYKRLVAAVGETATVQVIGTLQKRENKFSLDVRDFEILNKNPS